MAIMIVAIIVSIALVKSHRKKGNNAMVQCHRFILAGYYDVVIYSTANTEDPYYSTVIYEEPYYSTVSTQQPDAIEMKQNDVYGMLPPVQQQIIVEENPLYIVTAQNLRHLL